MLDLFFVIETKSKEENSWLKRRQQKQKEERREETKGGKTNKTKKRKTGSINARIVGLTIKSYTIFIQYSLYRCI